MSVTVEESGPIAVVTVDNPPVNALSQPVREGLLDAVHLCDANPSIRAVVLTCAGRTFVAGADIKEFGKAPVAPHLPDVLTDIENAKKPWVAAIHGTALGGGLELAMACRTRVAASTAKMGLPEVTLGLIPGAGGTVRLPRLVSADLALTMIAGGKPINAREAQAAGLISACVDGDMVEAAKRAADALTGNEPTVLGRPVIEPQGREQFDDLKRKLLSKARGQASIAAAVKAVETALACPAETALEKERATFLDLKGSDQSAALRHIFFAERATLSDPRCKMDPRSVGHVGVIGGGTMGAGIAAACVLADLRVTLVERDRDAATAGADRVLSILEQSTKRGIISADRKTALVEKFAAVDTYAPLEQVDLVIEAVFEDMDVKKQVFKELDRITRKDTILATNTSYLDVNEIAQTIDDPSRVVGLHFFSPAHIMKLLEIVLPENVADDVVATAAALSKRLRKTAVLSGVCDGFIGNRIMSAYRREADYLLEDGALPDQVDRAMRDFGFPMGIFEMQDLAGLDIGWAMRKRRAATRDPEERYVDIADKLCERERFGRKSGKGWYVYPSGKAEIDPEVTALILAERERKGITGTTFTDEEIMARIMASMQSEARKVLEEGIALSGSDIDVVMINGYAFPRWRGGPMFMDA